MRLSTNLPAARETGDERIVDFAGGRDDACIAPTIKYRRVSSPQESRPAGLENAGAGAVI
jgi:hypothetical protein